jgi:zinc-ribbon domain
MARMLPVPPRNLADQAYMATRSDQQLFTVIRQGGAAVGLSAAMSAFGTQLTVQELWDTVAYVRTLPALTHTPTDAPKTVLPDEGGSSTNLRMARLRLSIWPEYDDPRVLVMFRGEMAPHSAFPTHITLPLPKGAAVIGAGMISEQGELLLHPHQVKPGEADDSLEINLPVARFFVEFYYNPFAEGTEKRFTYAAPTIYPIERLEVDIQQPLQATRFITDPQAMRSETDEQGFTYHRFIYHNLSKGATRRFTVTYTKTVAVPSVTKGQPTSEVIQQPRTAVHDLVLAFGMLGGAAVVFGGGTLLWTSFQRRRQASPTHQKPPVSAPAAVQPHTQTTFAPMPTTSGRHTPNFCSNCGAKLRPEYRFCPGCGRPSHHET